MTAVAVKRLALIPALETLLSSPGMAQENPGAGVSPDVNPLWIAPFVLLLLAIAVFPFLNRRAWERYYPSVCLVLAGATVAYYWIWLGNPLRLMRSGIEYVSFIVLIGSLFVVSGGILVHIRGKATPGANLLLLAVGAVLSNLLGTTGASMVLIRPYLRANRYRLRGYHVVFFIFIVSNIGGALTPIGDPPLFLGFLRGVPFFWVMENVWGVWLLALSLMLGVFLALDTVSYRKALRGGPEEPDGSEFHEQAQAQGLHNIFFLCVILLAVFIQRPAFLRELLMILAAAGSYATTRRSIHVANEFSFGPIREVAVLFAGIFATMVPALDWLETHAGALGTATAGKLFWSTGMLSSVLDNAPTYLSFLSASIGLFADHSAVSTVQQLISSHGAGIVQGGDMAEPVRRTWELLQHYHGGMVSDGSVPAVVVQVAYLLANHPAVIRAISMGAVFFGACTYIGNGPNFMVKSIAEHMGVETVSFFGYIFRYTLPVLIPVFALIWLIFFST